MTIHPHLVNISPHKIIFTPKYVDLRFFSGRSPQFGKLVLWAGEIIGIGGGGRGITISCLLISLLLLFICASICLSKFRSQCAVQAQMKRALRKVAYTHSKPTAINQSQAIPT